MTTSAAIVTNGGSNMHYSASICLARRREDLEIFLVRRSPSTSFLSGFHAFPGGLMEPEDQRDGEVLSQHLRRAAARETEEEVGVTVDANALITLGQWVAPAYLVRRLTTEYFLSWIDAQTPQVDPNQGELDQGEWMTPGAALSRWHGGELLLAPPTRVLLSLLHEHREHPETVQLNVAEAAGEEPTLSAIRSDLMMIPLRTPTLPPATHTNAYVLGAKSLIVVEPASPHPDVRDYLYRYIDERLTEGASVKAVVLTHHHHDHIGGAHPFAQRYAAPIWAHPETASRVPFEVDHHLDEGDIIETDPGSRWLVLHTPGHAPGHLCLLHQTTRSMVVGDMVAGLGSILVEPNDGDMTDYLESLRRMITYNPSCLLPSHGPPIGGAIEKLEQYIEHRLARESSIIDVLRGGETDFMAILALVYADVPAVLRGGPGGGIAGLSLRSHLIKLEREGRVGRVDDQWSWHDTTDR